MSVINVSEYDAEAQGGKVQVGSVKHQIAAVVGGSGKIALRGERVTQDKVRPERARGCKLDTHAGADISAGLLA